MDADQNWSADHGDSPGLCEGEAPSSLPAGAPAPQKMQPYSCIFILVGLICNLEVA